MDEKDLDYTAIRRRVAGRFRKRLIFFVHFSLFVLYALYSVYVLFSPIFRSFGAHVLVLGIWGGFIFLHYVYAFEVWSKWLDRATQREMARLRGQDQVTAQQKQEKPKRDHLVRLSEDGELVYEPEPERKRARK